MGTYSVTRSVFVSLVCPRAFLAEHDVPRWTCTTVVILRGAVCAYHTHVPRTGHQPTIVTQVKRVLYTHFLTSEKVAY